MPDLKLTGAFYNSFKMMLKGKKVEINATDSKTAKLIAKYGPDIFGLTADSMTELQQVAVKEMIKRFKQQAGMK